jgi:hypothetical protein
MGGERFQVPVGPGIAWHQSIITASFKHTEGRSVTIALDHRETADRESSLRAAVSSAITAAINTRTRRSVRRLVVSEEPSYVVIRGKAPSYYAAQLALAAAQEVMRTQEDARALRLAITVEGA